MSLADVTTVIEGQVRDAGEGVLLGKGLLSGPEVTKDLSWRLFREEQTLLVSECANSWNPSVSVFLVSWVPSVFVLFCCLLLLF